MYTIQLDGLDTFTLTLTYPINPSLLQMLHEISVDGQSLRFHPEFVGTVELLLSRADLVGKTIIDPTRSLIYSDPVL